MFLPKLDNYLKEKRYEKTLFSISHKFINNTPWLFFQQTWDTESRQRQSTSSTLGSSQPIPRHILEARQLWFMGQIWPSVCFWKTQFYWNTITCNLFTYCLCFCAKSAMLSSCNKVAPYGRWGLKYCYLALYRKSSPIPVTKQF